jgi:hypothetical protein
MKFDVSLIFIHEIHTHDTLFAFSDFLFSRIYLYETGAGHRQYKWTVIAKYSRQQRSGGNVGYSQS